MEINSIEDAINLTINKYEYNESIKQQIYEELNKGNFDIITRDKGARDFVINNYKKTNVNYKQSNSLQFADLNMFFDYVLSIAGIDKNNQTGFRYLYNHLDDIIQNNTTLQIEGKTLDKDTIQKFAIEAAKQYSDEAKQYAEVLRKYDFKTPDITRKEACDITKIYSNMEHQKYKVENAWNGYPNYRRVLLNNLINYSYYENNFNQNLDDEISEIQRSYK